MIPNNFAEDIAESLPGALKHANLISNDEPTMITEWEGNKTVCKIFGS
jgi:hypothetical protein